MYSTLLLYRIEVGPTEHQKRVALLRAARAAAADSVVADEPTSAFAFKTALEVSDLVRALFDRAGLTARDYLWGLNLSKMQTAAAGDAKQKALMDALLGTSGAPGNALGLAGAFAAPFDHANALASLPVGSFPFGIKG